MNVAFSAVFNEHILVERLKSGERTAFAELYDRYGQAIFSTIFEITGSETDAENLMQDSFVKIWRNIERYDLTKGKLYTWLIVIARRVALDFVRSNYFSEKKKIQTPETAVSVTSPASEMTQLEYIGLDKAVSKLDSHLRQVIDLQYFMGYTQQEVADETGLPLGTVKTRTRAALLFLRNELKNEHV